MRRFMLTRLEKVISGPGSVTAIAEELDRRNVTRAVLITGASLGRSTLLSRVTQAMGSRCAAVSTGAAQHAPGGAVRAMGELLDAVDADGVVSFGGGSAIDSAKVAAASRINGRDMTREAGALDLARAFDPVEGPGLPHIAIPTTLSAGAFTPAGGVTDDGGVKHAVIDPRLQPCVVIHDPELCVETPDQLWVTTGIRVLDHAIEAIYAKRAHPLSTALAIRAIRMIIEHLPGSRGTDGASIEHRGQCLDAAWLSLYGGFNTGLGLSHALGHQIGPAWNVPHGVTSCLALAPSMRFMADVAPQRFADIAEGLKLPFDSSRGPESALRCADAVERFISQFDVPTRLHQLGVDADSAVTIAGAVQHELELFDAVDRPVTTDEIRALLRVIHR